MDDKPKILIIDDEDIVLDSCIQILRTANYQIRTAKDGVEGIALLEDIHPDLVFVDLKMPGLSGFDVIEHIRGYDPTIVTIVITGFATVSSAVEAMKKGTFDFLPKPFTPDELRLITQRGLERRNLILETIKLRQEKEMLREHFAAIISHELKSPLGVVQQNLYVLIEDLSDNLSVEQKQKLERLQTRIGALIKMINTWLRAISVDISSIRDNFTMVSIPDVVKKAVESVEVHAIRKAIDLKIVIADSLHPVQGDEGTLVEAMLNLLSNAVKYSRLEGCVVVGVSENDEELLVTIADKGVGIAKEDLPRLFEDFYIGKSTTEDERRSGVGLAITRRIVEAHNGYISVESELGRGSTFVVHLPITRSNE